MAYLSRMTDIARSEGDPTVLEKGASARGVSDRLAQGLGWFSIGLGLTELLNPRAVTRALGVEGHETLVRAMGVRELAAGVACLSTEKVSGVWMRVAGDVLDVGALLLAYRDANRQASRQKGNVTMALAAVTGVTLLDLATADALTMRHRRPRGPQRDYSDRSGWPQGKARARGAAADFPVPQDYRAVPMAAYASQANAPTSGATV